MKDSPQLSLRLFSSFSILLLSHCQGIAKVTPSFTFKQIPFNIVQIESITDKCNIKFWYRNVTIGVENGTMRWSIIVITLLAVQRAGFDTRQGVLSQLYQEWGGIPNIKIQPHGKYSYKYLYGWNEARLNKNWLNGWFVNFMNAVRKSINGLPKS